MTRREFFRRVWCVIRGKHHGRIYYTSNGPYWRCDNCLEVVR